MKDVNLFICHNPFQYYISRHLCAFHFNAPLSENWVVISFETNIPAANFKLIVIQNNPLGKLSGLLKTKTFLARLAIQHRNKLSVFLPNIHGILGNYVFHSNLLRKKQVNINFYYEGIVMMMSEQIRKNLSFPRQFFLRILLALPLAHRFRLHKDVLPLNDPRINKIYTPNTHYTSGPREKLVEIQFPKRRAELIPERCLILGLDVGTRLEEGYARLINFIQKSPGIKETIYKPHYAAKNDLFPKLARDANFVFTHIQTNLCVEEMIDEIKPGIVICLYLSSALINLKLIYGSNIQILCIANETHLRFAGNIAFAESLGVEITPY